MVDEGGDLIVYRPVGRVESLFEDPGAVGQAPASESRIVLDPTVSGGVQGLKAGDRVVVLFHFHRSSGYDLYQHPKGDRNRPLRGVFSLRSHRRPNPIGVTVVEVVAIEGNILQVRGLDAINGTPILDIKPA
jgi:tRNA-Thr(GGU) m(6)t(6)A37 methyltransferase TsaA